MCVSLLSSPSHYRSHGRVALHHLVEDLRYRAADRDPRRHREQTGVVYRANEEPHHRADNKPLYAAVRDVHQQYHYAPRLVLVCQTGHEPCSAVERAVEDEAPVQRELPDVYDVVEERQTVALV